MYRVAVPGRRRSPGAADLGGGGRAAVAARPGAAVAGHRLDQAGRRDGADATWPVSARYRTPAASTATSSGRSSAASTARPAVADARRPGCRRRRRWRCARPASRAGRGRGRIRRRTGCRPRPAPSRPRGRSQRRGGRRAVVAEVVGVASAGHRSGSRRRDRRAARGRCRRRRCTASRPSPPRRRWAPPAAPAVAWPPSPSSSSGSPAARDRADGAGRRHPADAVAAGLGDVDAPVGPGGDAAHVAEHGLRGGRVAEAGRREPGDGAGLGADRLRGEAPAVAEVHAPWPAGS